MKFMTIKLVFAGLTLAGCETNPGNIGAGMYEDMVAQRAALQGGGTAMGGSAGELAATSVAMPRPCEEIDAEIIAIYMDMQPEEAGIVKRALSTGQGIGETIGLQQVTNHIPGAGMVNGLLKMRSGKKKADEMFRGQLTPTGRLGTLQKERTIGACPGSMLELFEEK
jgi:hypothetical protein